MNTGNHNVRAGSGVMHWLSLPVRGTTPLFRDPKIFKYLIVPWGLTLLGTIVVGGGVYLLSPDLLIPGGAGGDAVSWGYGALYCAVLNAAVVFTGFQVGLAAGAGSYETLLTKLHRRVIEGDKEAEGPTVGLRAVLGTGIRVILYGLVQWQVLTSAAADGEGWMPAVSLGITVVWTAFTYVEFAAGKPEASGNRPSAGRIRYILRHPGRILAFSAGMTGLLLIPLISVIWAPVGLVAFRYGTADGE